MEARQVWFHSMQDVVLDAIVEETRYASRQRHGRSLAICTFVDDDCLATDELTDSKSYRHLPHIHAPERVPASSSACCLLLSQETARIVSPLVLECARGARFKSPIWSSEPQDRELNEAGQVASAILGHQLKALVCMLWFKRDELSIHSSIHSLSRSLSWIARSTDYRSTGDLLNTLSALARFRSRASWWVVSYVLRPRLMQTDAAAAAASCTSSGASRTDSGAPRARALRRGA